SNPMIGGQRTHICCHEYPKNPLTMEPALKYVVKQFRFREGSFAKRKPSPNKNSENVIGHQSPDSNQ
ncbi:hypothetical protein GWI33_003980, partial [Rhynchophorus ferrugineus]